MIFCTIFTTNFKADPHSKRKVVCDTEFDRKYGGWYIDKDASPRENLSCHAKCISSSPCIYEIEDEEHEFYVPDEEKVRSASAHYNF